MDSPWDAHLEDCEWEVWEREYKAAKAMSRQPKAEPPSTKCPYSPKSCEALEWALTLLNINVRFNLRWGAAEWRQGDNWNVLTGRASAWIRNRILTTFTVENWRGEVRLEFGKDSFNESLDAMLHTREGDPFRDYLESLEIPTGRRILPKALSSCMNVADGYEELAEWASRNIFLGGVWRTLQPGTKMDEIAILTGPGSIGKSTFPAHAVPQDIPGLYGSGLDLSGDAKTKVEALQGKLILEISEMAGLLKSDLAKVKDYISRTDDLGIRLSYRRDPEPMPRRCVMVGTADKLKFLPHDDNPRRFVPVVLNHGDARKVRRYMAKNRDRLWAEAMDMCHNGQTAHLPENLKARALQAAFDAML